MLFSKLKGIITAFEFRGLFAAIFTWPKFSIASFIIISRVKKLDINPSTVIDLGANKGQFAVAAAKIFEGVKIYSVEPDPCIAVILKKNLQDIAHALVFETAIGDSTGEVKFHINKDSQVSSILPLGKDRISMHPSSTVIKMVKVPLTTLDALFENEVLVLPILLKIDVQGFEDKVLKGGTKLLEKINWVIIEVSFANLYEGECDFVDILEIMKELGFMFKVPLNWHTSPHSKQVIEMDALFQKISENKMIDK